MSSDSMDDLFECAMCTSDMVRRNPRVLQCLHSFCESCLQQLTHDDVIKCPSCRKVTHVTDDDVTSLPINFPLIKMRERELKRNKSPKPLPKNDKICQVCDHAVPLYKCEKCVKNMCEECKANHDELSGYKEHPVVELCASHGDVITHLCHQCVMPVCMKCMLGTHKEHKEHFEEYGKDLTKFQSGAKKMYSQLQQVTAVLEEWFENVKTKAKSTRAIKKGVQEQYDRYQERAAYYTQKAKEAEQIVKVIENKYENHQQFLTAYNDAKELCNTAVSSLKSVATGDGAGIFNRYAVAKGNWSKAVSAVKETKERRFKVPPFVLSEPGSKEIVTYPPKEEEKPKVIKSKQIEEISKPRSRAGSEASPKPIVKKKPEGLSSRKNTLEQEPEKLSETVPIPNGAVPKTKKSSKDGGKSKKEKRGEAPGGKSENEKQPSPGATQIVKAPPVEQGGTKLILNISGSVLEQYIRRPHQIAIAGDDSVVIAEFDLKHVIRMDYGGNIIGKYVPNIEDEAVWGSDCIGGTLYILQKNFISKMPLTSNSPENTGTYKPGGTLCKFVILNENKFVISDGTGGNVFEYLVEDGSYNKVISKLNFASFLSKFDAKDGPIFVVTEANAHKIRVYNHDWKLLSKFGGQGEKDGKFNIPGATAVTEKATILVTDFKNHRVSQFTLSGTFISHVLTYKDHGVQYPQVLAYKAPYLWVGEKFGDHIAIKCYQITL